VTETPPGESEQAFLDRAVVIALGSNLPGAYPTSRELLDAALRALDGNGLKVTRTSSWWSSKAWPEGSGPDFLNGVALVETALSPPEVLAILQAIEQRFGRDRATPNAARTLDLDLIAHGRGKTSSVALTVPHPRSGGRLFVMGPLAEIAPSWAHPITGAAAADLARGAEVGLDAERSVANPSKLP
jgi:2-amino-4-hydroxy-6-hydroxymethyldihydropteridine diphosphokinase